MAEEYEVHGHHDHVVEHSAGHDGLSRWVAVFTALLATLGAIISYQNGNSESRGLEYKNEAILKKSEASDKWAFYQAKSIKQTIVAAAVPARAEDRARLAAEVSRYDAEKAAIQNEALALDQEAKRFDAASELAVRPHHHLAQALALVQVGIALAALTVLTRQRWMLGLAGVSALTGIGFWILAWTAA